MIRNGEVDGGLRPDASSIESLDNVLAESSVPSQREFIGCFVHGFRSELEEKITVTIRPADLHDGYPALPGPDFDAPADCSWLRPTVYDWRCALAKHFGPKVSPSYRWVLIFREDELLDETWRSLDFSEGTDEGGEEVVYRACVRPAPELADVWSANPPRLRDANGLVAEEVPQLQEGFVGDWSNRLHVEYYMEMTFRMMQRRDGIEQDPATLARVHSDESFIFSIVLGELGFAPYVFAEPELWALGWSCGAVESPVNAFPANFKATAWRDPWVYSEILRLHASRTHPWHQENAVIAWRDNPHWRPKSEEDESENVAPHPLQHAPAFVLADAARMGRAVRCHPMVLQYASDTVRDDKNVVLLAVTAHGEALKFASSRLQVDPEIVAHAVVSPFTWPVPIPEDASAAQQAVEQSLALLRSSLSVTFARPRGVLEESPFALESALEVANQNLSIVRRIVELQPSFYLQLSEAMRCEPLVATAAVKTVSRQEHVARVGVLDLQSIDRGSASPRIPVRRSRVRREPLQWRWDNGKRTLDGFNLSDCSFLRLGALVKHLPMELATDRDFVLTLVEADAGLGFDFMDDKFRSDIDIMNTAVHQDATFRRYANIADIELGGKPELLHVVDSCQTFDMWLREHCDGGSEVSEAETEWGSVRSSGEDGDGGGR